MPRRLAILPACGIGEANACALDAVGFSRYARAEVGDDVSVYRDESLLRGSIVTTPMRLALVVCAVANALLLLSLYNWGRRKGEPYAVATLIIALSVGIEYCIRPLSLATTGELGWDPTTFRPLTADDAGAVGYAAAVSTVCVLALTLAIRLVGGRIREPAPETELPQQSDSAATLRQRPVVGFLLGAALISVAMGTSYGTFGTVFGDSLGRSKFTSGYAYALVNLASAAILIVLKSESGQRLARRPVRLALYFAALSAAAVYMLILGGRDEIVAVGIASVVLLRVKFGRPSSKKIVAGAIAAILVSSIYRVATREVHYPSNEGVPRAQLVVQSFADPLGLVTRGDVSSFDKLIVLHETPLRVSPGSTYVAALLAPVPGKVKSETLQGGSQAFTRLYLPDRYAYDATYEGVSLAGEGILNFGTLGAVLVYLLFGLAIGLILRRGAGRVSLAVALAMGILPSALRADAFNSLSLTLAFVLAIAVCSLGRRLFATRSSAQATSAVAAPAGGSRPTPQSSLVAPVRDRRRSAVTAGRSS